MKRRPPAETVGVRLTNRDDFVTGELNLTHLVANGRERSGKETGLLLPARNLRRNGKRQDHPMGKGQRPGGPVVTATARLRLDRCLGPSRTSSFKCPVPLCAPPFDNEPRSSHHEAMVAEWGKWCKLLFTLSPLYKSLPRRDSCGCPFIYSGEAALGQPLARGVTGAVVCPCA